jgi:hypothetical protein
LDKGAPDVEARTEIVATQPVEGHVLTPDWVKEAVFYHIFPDRFATSRRVEKPPNLEPWEALPTTHGFKGGDLLGVVEHLDYLRYTATNRVEMGHLVRHHLLPNRVSGYVESLSAIKSIIRSSEIPCHLE